MLTLYFDPLSFGSISDPTHPEKDQFRCYVRSHQRAAFDMNSNFATIDAQDQFILIDVGGISVAAEALAPAL